LRIFFFFHLPWRWRRYVPLKRRLTQYLHGAISQKTAFFIVTAVEISNLIVLLVITILVIISTFSQEDTQMWLNK
jgi:hypothetical protein